MRRALIAVAVTALMGGLVVAPVTEQTARAGFSGLKPAGTVPSGNLVTLVRHGGGGGHGGGHMGGGHGHMGGGHYGGGHAFRGGGSHYRGGGYAYRGGGGHYRGGHVYRGSGHRYGHYYGGPRHYYGGKSKHYAYKNRRYYRGRYYRYGWWPYVGVGVGYGYYGYGGCAWLRRQALATGSSYWWQRYYDCIYY